MTLRQAFDVLAESGVPITFTSIGISFLDHEKTRGNPNLGRALQAIQHFRDCGCDGEPKP